METSVTSQGLYTLCGFRGKRILYTAKDFFTRRQTSIYNPHRNDLIDSESSNVFHMMFLFLLDEVTMLSKKQLKKDYYRESKLKFFKTYFKKFEHRHLLYVGYGTKTMESERFVSLTIRLDTQEVFVSFGKQAVLFFNPAMSLRDLQDNFLQEEPMFSEQMYIPEFAGQDIKVLEFITVFPFQEIRD